MRGRFAAATGALVVDTFRESLSRKISSSVESVGKLWFW